MSHYTSETYSGVIKRTVYDRGYGFIRVEDGRDAFFHVTYLVEPDNPPVEGTAVIFLLEDSQKGLQARDVVSEDALTLPQPTQAEIAARAHSATSRSYAAQASLARERRQWDLASRIYETALSECPSIQIILSYAAMLKNANRRTDAMRIYERGIRMFPRSAKLCEDAGVLAKSAGEYRKAVALLTRALTICQRYQQPGAKGVLLALGRTYYAIATQRDLCDCIRCYEDAHALFASESAGHARLPRADMLQLNLARIRTTHHRGDVAVQFLTKLGFTIVDAALLPQKTVGADLTIRITSQEYIESYGISPQLLVRCLFKASVDHQDLRQLDNALANCDGSDVMDDQVAVIFIASLPDHLQRTLYRRIEERKHSRAAIIPVTQALAETADDAHAALRSAFDRWLYRRDLFSCTFPVAGRRFFGREQPLNELKNAITSATPLGIFGLRKVGKTSLLKETERRATESGDIVIYMDLLSIPADSSPIRWLYHRLATLLRAQAELRDLASFEWKLGGVFNNILDVPPDFAVATAFDVDLHNGISEIERSSVSPRPKIVLLLDEIERLLPALSSTLISDECFSFLAHIRGVSQQTSDCVVVVTGANAGLTEASQLGQRDNPVFNYFREVYLQLLDSTECAIMMKALGKGMGVRFKDTACRLVHRLTGGHPLFARQLCSYVLSRYNDRPIVIDDGMINGVVPDYLELSSKDCREILDRLKRDYPAERQLCLELARCGGKMRLETIRNEEVFRGVTTKHLVGYQIARVEQGEVSLTMELLYRWINGGYVSEWDSRA